MEIGLIHMDGSIPNLALMQIAAYHKKRGDSVGWWNGPLFSYDRVYASKIFKQTSDELPGYVIRGGTGFDENEPMQNDMQLSNPGEAWELYPKYKNHLGFSEIGCRLKCSFCVVPTTHGQPRQASSIKDLLVNPNGEDRLCLLDDDFLGHPNSEEVFAELIDRDLRVNFICGLNIRLITEKQAQLLSRTNFWNKSFKSRQVSFAWDIYKDKKIIERGFKRCVEAGIKPWKMQFFVLIGYDSTPEEDRERVETIRNWGADPFVMAYDRRVKYQNNFQRWVNHRAIFNTIKFEDYRPATKK